MPLMNWPDLMSRPSPHATERIQYGPEPSQIADLWLPDDKDAHPVVVMIHGGCWTKSIADLSIMDWAAEDLRQRGYAVWNIEYRRLGEPGGGYPGAYDDIRAGLRLVRNRTKAPLPVVILGHSAGGHLALWAAHQPELKARAVVALGAIADLEADTETACGAEAPARMRGPLKETSPYQMGPLTIPTVLITGSEDTTVPPSIAHRYADEMRRLSKAAHVEVHTPPGGHVEEIAPGTEAWKLVVQAIERAVKR